MENQLTEVGHRAQVEVINPEIIQMLVLQGDISQMNGNQRVEYYNRFCQSLGLNPLTQPFQIIKFQGKERLYATKDCTEQLRKIYGVSVTDLKGDKLEDTYIVRVTVRDREGRTDIASGAVVMGNLKGEALANCIMKAETKAKRRATLSICGLGMLDESEIDTLPGKVETTPIEIVEPKTALLPTPAPAWDANRPDPHQSPELRRLKAELLLLLNSSVFTQAEKDKSIAAINKMDEEKLSKAIEKTKQTIKEREETLAQATSSADSTPATKKQLDLLDKLITSHVFTPKEKVDYENERKSLTLATAGNLIEVYQKEIKLRKEIENEEVNHAG